jgi:hypothetical protein
MLSSCALFSDAYKSEVDGVYIPKNLEDALVTIDTQLNDSTKVKIKKMSEDDFIAEVHFGKGLQIRNNWNLWKGSRLSRYFNRKGIRHPDDMSGIILRSYYRRLQGKDIQLKAQIASAKAYWKGVKKTVLPKPRKHPEPNLEFRSGIHYGYYTENKKWANVHIQTNSTTDLHWIYDYYYGWKQISTETKKRLEDAPIEQTEALLNEIFNIETTSSNNH